MPAKKYTQVPTRDEWRKDRDNAGGTSNLCGKVNIGELLDTYHKNKTKKKERRLALEALRDGLVRYTAEKKVKAISDLHKTAMSIHKVTETELLAMEMDRDIGLAVARTVADGLQRLEKVAASLKAGKIAEAREDYERFYDGIGRGLGKILPSGGVRDYWEDIYKNEVSREDVTKVSDNVALAGLLVKGIKGYRAALHKVLELAEEQGWPLKL